MKRSAVELFSGAGGASVGIHRAGLACTTRVEWDADAARAATASGYPTTCADVREAYLPMFTSLLWASPPCQAWSTGGNRLGAMDPRNGWPWVLDALDRCVASTVILENVPGMLYHKGKAGCEKGTRPRPMECPGCYWQHVVLPSYRERFRHVRTWELNAADYGVPQSRRRVFLVASDAPLPDEPPPPTHGELQLARAKWETGDYWRERGLQPVGSPTRSEARMLRFTMPGGDRYPWVTMWDALGVETFGGGHNPNRPGDERTYRDTTHTPSPTIAAQQAGNAGPFVRHLSDSAGTVPRTAHEVAPTIGTKGTTGLEYGKGQNPELAHRPSATVTASEWKGTNGKESTGWTANGGPARASDTLWLATGKRLLTPRECATLQGFPADHRFHGSKRQQYKQIGNAVPPALAEAIVRHVMG